MRISLTCLLVAGFASVQALAQPLAAFVNIQNEFMVYDRSSMHKADFMPPTNFKVGRTTVPFLDNSRSFKIYYGGSVQSVNDGITNAYFPTDNLVGYLNQKSLNVFDGGVSKNLTGVCDQYFIQDSVILFLDSYKGEYRAYYKGETYTVESYIQDSVLSHVKVASNIVAYDNFASQFRIFFRGAVLPQEEYPVYSFEAGRSTVAYVDIDHKFKIFHNGQTFMAEDIAPGSYKVGSDLVAYVSGDGYFKIFYGDSIHTVGFMSPSYRVGDNMVGFKDPSGAFKVFYKGEIYDVDVYYPSTYVIQYNSIAYVNTANTLRVFTEGEGYDVTSAEITNWTLNYDVITYEIGTGFYKVFYKGNDY